jgi:hypothetical protein
MHRSCAAGLWHIGTPGLPHPGTASFHATQGSAWPTGRRKADRRHHQTRPPIWTIRVSNGHGFAQLVRLTCEPQAGRTHLEARRAEGSTETAEEGPVSGRTMSGPTTSCRSHPRRAGLSNAEHHRRVHQGCLDDPCRSQANVLCRERPMSGKSGCLGQQVMGHPVSRMP